MRGRSCTPLLRALAVTAIASALCFTTAYARTWTASDGRKVEGAVFLKLEGETVHLKLANNKEIQIPLASLAKGDQEAAQRFAILGDDTLTKASANKIDQLLAKNLVTAGFKSFNTALPDDLFVRRVYLDIIGRIPTREEFLRFAESSRPDKRAALIDELLVHPGYSSHMFNYFADMYRLHADAEFPPGIRMEPYIQWWKEQLQNNAPYDKMVRDMITATGNVGQNPASGFLLRDAGMEFDAFANFGQVLLSIDLSCAQCHDHPFADWTMDEFYSMAAFFGQTQRTLQSYAGMMMGGGGAKMPGAPEDWRMQFDNFAKSKGVPVDDQMGGRNFRYFTSFLGWNVADNEALVIPIPSNITDMAGQTPRPKTMIGGPAKISGKSRREALAEWLTAPDNPRFAPGIANRMWYRAFGRALVEPVHDFPVDWMKSKDVSAQPEVLGFVSAEMQRVNYNLRAFMRTLYNTRAYQSMATTEEPSIAKPYVFNGPILRRMRAEQAWDSLMVLAHGPEVDSVKGRDGSFIRSVLNVDFKKETLDSVFAKYEAYIKTGGDSLGAAMVSEPGTFDFKMPQTPRLGNVELIRASEMVQPAPGASLLDTFGQSDRMVTDEHTFDGSVPQVLALMNGTVTERLTGGTSKVVEDLSTLDAPEDKVRGVYFTMLSRFPSEDEQRLGVEILDDYGDDGIRDLAWALMNSPEFLFIQ